MTWYRLRKPRAVLFALGVSLSIPDHGMAQRGPAASLDVKITGIESDKGIIRLALCPPGADFPDCGEDAVRTAALPIENGEAQVALFGLTPGNYAVSVFHDANSNGKLDTFVGIPREGYGFSNNPPFQPRAPRFSEGRMTVIGRGVATIRLRYLL